MISDLLCADKVSFCYPGDGRGLQTITLTVSEGERVHLSGSSGSGKSTLARCLSGIIPHLYHGKMHGNVWVVGQRSDQTPLWKLSEQVGLVFQNPANQMLAHSVSEELEFGLENLGLPAAEINCRVQKALDIFGLAEMHTRAPQTLSGGEQQKLALASILARQPAVLVLDEPLSMLDTSAAFEFVDLLNHQAEQGIALVICEHRHEYLQHLAQLRTIQLEGTHPVTDTLPTLPPINIDKSSNSGDRGYNLQAESLSVKRGQASILEDLSFSLQAGQVYSLVGPNGVGKTTLLRTLAGFQPYQGELTVTSPGRQENPRFGIVFQNPDLQLFNASVREEILYGVNQPDLQLYQQLLTALDLKRYEHTPPLLLSEGEKRRLALATVLMHRPAHGILLDEPALGQDQDHKYILMNVLRAVAATGKIVLYCTHDIELAVQADQMLLLGNSGLVASGQPASVLHNDEAWDCLRLKVPGWIKP